jgi:NAD(P)-dependent dehydrogenase (short-subunit alcohol dehydrogenase family)
MDTFAGRTAVITGGASGIGYAMAKRFAAEGMNLVLGDIEAEALAMAEAAFLAEGAKVLAVRTNVGKPESVEALAEAAYARFGAVHVLCNNAGVGGSIGEAWELSQGDWEWLIDVNLWSVIHGIRSFVPRMLAAGEPGHIVNTASIAGLMTGFVGPAYQATKFAVVGLSENVYRALKLRQAHVSCSVLCPSFVSTRIGESQRNRPGEYGPAPVLDPAMAQVREQLREQVFAKALIPDDVATMVFEAVREDRFYIVPASERHQNTIWDRHARMQAGENPALEVDLF